MDFVRALAIILIVVCHLHYYVNMGHYQNLLIIISRITAFIGLSLFFFVSGFSLYYNYDQIRSLKEVINFYFKRAIRIYPLFWVSISIFSIWNILYNGYLLKPTITYFALLISVLGLQGLVTIHTMGWFIGIILLYYFLYPMFIRSKNIINIFFASTIILSIFIFLHFEFDMILKNFFVYYYTFILGIIICWLKLNYTLKKPHLPDFSHDLDLKKWIYNLIILTITGVILLLIDPKFQQVANFSYDKSHSISVFMLLPLILLIYFGIKIMVDYISRNYNEFFKSKTYGLIKKISFATYAIFIFHSMIFITLGAILEQFNLNVGFNNFLIIIIGIPLALISGYYIQVLELKLRLKLLSKKN